jgi:predicted Na+-dependent transporter
MLFSVDTWLLPAIAAGSSSYLVCLAWERLRNQTAPSGLLSAFLAGLSFLMGAISSYYRFRLLSQSLESNVIIMFVVGASTTYLWLLLRKYLPGFGRRDN